MQRDKQHVRPKDHGRLRRRPVEQVLAEVIRTALAEKSGPLVIAIGGPGGTGKSTFARKLAARLGDAAFARPGLYERLEAERYLYAIRLPANSVLQEEIEPFLTRPVGRPSNAPVVWYHDFHYQAGSWDRPRRVVAKIEHQREKGDEVHWRKRRGAVQCVSDCPTAESSKAIREIPDNRAVLRGHAQRRDAAK